MSYDKKIRVALMTHTIDGRRAKGTALVARECVEALLARRDEFDLTFVHYENCDDPIYMHGVREVILPKLGPSIINRRSLRQILYFFATTDRFDIFHWFQPRLYPFFWVAPAKHLVVTVHGAEVARAEPFNGMVFLFLWTLRLFRNHISAAIAVSNYAREAILREYGFSKDRVRVIHNGVDPRFRPSLKEEVKRVREKYGLPDHFFLNVARLNPSKNAFRVLRAYDRYVREHADANIHFVNVGSEGFEKDAVMNFIRASSVHNRIHLVRYVEDSDLPAVYSAAYALIFPLLNDGLGLPLLEAMACGVPVVASKTAHPEISHDEAILVDAMSEKEIAEAMHILVSDKQLRDRLTSSGKRTAGRFTWDAMGEQVVSLYKELMRAGS